ncbi:MAG: ATP-dependent exonuclease, partial [Flavobacteriales bacterium]
FKKGEVLEYRLHYGVINAGTARIEVKKEDKKIGGREVYHVVGSGKSNRFFDMFFKVRDRYESYIDADGLFPWAFIRRVNEGGFIINQDYTFYQHKNQVNNGKGKEFETPIDVQDMISAFYRARTFDFTNISAGDTFAITAFMDDELWPAQIKFIGFDTIDVETGTYSCLKFIPIVQKGRVFNDEDNLVVWISNDKNKIPILAKAKVLVGSIRMDLTSYSGLSNPVAKLEE